MAFNQHLHSESLVKIGVLVATANGGNGKRKKKMVITANYADSHHAQGLQIESIVLDFQSGLAMGDDHFQPRFLFCSLRLRIL